MNQSSERWRNQGAGEAPDSVLEFRADAELTDVAAMVECGDFVAADAMGNLYRLDPLLNVTLVTRLAELARLLAWSAVGHYGVAVVGKNSLVGLDAGLKVLWTTAVPFTCTALAIDPFGSYTMVASADGGFLLLDDRGKRIRQVETARPLIRAEFVYDEPVFLAIAEHGLLGAYAVTGKKIWEQTPLSNLGDLSLLQQTGFFCLAMLNHGIQVFNGKAEQQGTLLLDGTVNRISASYDGRLVMAATVEGQLYRLNQQGETAWYSTPAVPVKRLFSHPLGQSAVVALQNSQLLRLEWNSG